MAEKPPRVTEVIARRGRDTQTTSMTRAMVPARPQMPDRLLGPYIVRMAWHRNVDLAFVYLYSLFRSRRHRATSCQHPLATSSATRSARSHFSPAWRTDTALALARQMYESRDFSAMPILADALQDAGCDNDDILNHCRDANGPHVRGCWVVDLVLGKA